MEIEHGVVYVEGGLIPETEEACGVIITQAIHELGTGYRRRGLGVGTRDSVVNHGDIVVQGVDVDGVRRRQLSRGGGL